MPVIKKNSIGSTFSRISDASLLDRQVRIPASAIYVAQVDGTHDGSETTGRLRVIRREHARMAASAFELDITELTNDRTDSETAEEYTEGAVIQPAVKSTEDLIAERDAQWEEHLQQAVAAAREDGYAEGSAETAARLEAAFHEQRELLLADLKQLESKWEEYIEKLEPALAALTFDIAQAILDAPLPPSVKGVASRAITEAVEQMAGSAPIDILIHPVDFLRLQESGIVDQLESLHTGVRWEPHPEMKHGEWVVQSPTMTVRRLEEELLSTIKSRLGLLAVIEKDRMHSK